MVDALVVPVGGGGMIAGIAIAVKVRKLLEDYPTLGIEDFISHHSTLWYLLNIPPQLLFPSFLST